MEKRRRGENVQTDVLEPQVGKVLPLNVLV